MKQTNNHTGRNLEAKGNALEKRSRELGGCCAAAGQGRGEGEILHLGASCASRARESARQIAISAPEAAAERETFVFIDFGLMGGKSCEVEISQKSGRKAGFFAKMQKPLPPDLGGLDQAATRFTS